ncbi:MAG TPA: GyrI-like domain-containing protein [Acidobacteriaceae bacterium]|nr:GyrI-like domain-containing protein [Acidobacteriaceae bacterium]
MAIAKAESMKLTQEPETVTWPEMHYVYVEAVGPFMTSAPEAWGQLHKLTDEIAEHNKITGYTSLYKVGPKIYRAGVSVAEEPKDLPDGVRSTRFKGGKYSQFVLTGRFADLPDASRRVFEIVAEKKIPLRDDFCIEHYVTDPRETPEDQNVIEIAVPTV